MSGINFNDLPSNLQQKLQPYRFVAKSVDDAIAMAKKAGKWTASDDKAYNSLNGGKAWGVFDGFEKTELGKSQADLADAVKQNPVTAMNTARKKSLQRDVEANPEKYAPKRFDMKSGRYVVYQIDKKTGKESRTYYDVNGEKMTAKAFERAEDLRYPLAIKKDQQGKLYAQARRFPSGDTQKATFTDENGNFSAMNTLKTVGIGTAQVVFGLFGMCGGDEITNIEAKNENKNIINITVDIQNAINAVIKKLDEISANTAFTNELLASILQCQNDLKAQLVKIQNNQELTQSDINGFKNQINEQLNKINQKMQTIISNQEYQAASADAFYKQILEVCNGNQELLKFVVEQLTNGNDTLNQIKELMIKSNANQQDILKAVAKCKYGLDVLHQDNKCIKKMLTVIASLIAKLPAELKAKFGDYFNKIITGITDNGTKLDALYSLLAAIDQNVQAGHTAILNKMDKMQAVLDAIYAKFDSHDAKVTNLLNAIATSIANMSGRDVDLDQIENTLDAILSRIGNDQGQMDDITSLLQAINANTVINGQTQMEILEAIKKLNGDMTAQFTKLIEIGNKNNKLQGDTNNLINEVLKAIKNFNIQPGSQAEIDLTALINTINANGADLSKKLSDILAAIRCLNANVVEGDNNIMAFLSKILGAIPKCVDKPDFSAILAKLDEILAAIKNHKVDVTVTVDGHFTICDKDGNVVHEGEIDNLDWVLG